MYGVIYEWDKINIVWYDSLKQAFDNANAGDIVIEKIEEIE